MTDRSSAPRRPAASTARCRSPRSTSRCAAASSSARRRPKGSRRSSSTPTSRSRFFRLPGRRSAGRVFERRRRRPVLLLEGEGTARIAVRRSPLSQERLSPRSSRHGSATPDLVPSRRNPLRAAGRPAHPARIPQPRRPAPHGRALHPPRLRPARLQGAAPGTEAHPREEGRRLRRARSPSSRPSTSSAGTAPSGRSPSTS